MALLTDEGVILLAQNSKIATYALEKVLATNSLVTLERAELSSPPKTLETSSPHYDYSRVLNTCCEKVLKADVEDLARLKTKKNLVGSAMAGAWVASMRMRRMC